MNNFNFFRLLLILMILMLSAASYGQKGLLAGHVVDKQSGEAMFYVTISVHELADSSLITGGITDIEGNFKIDDVPVGKPYLIKFSSIGYGTIFQQVDFASKKEIQLGTINLAPGNEILDGVDITVDKPIVTYEIDKKVVNVESMSTVASQTALEVLANIPSVSVDMDGNVSLRGSSGFTLLINGRPSALPASDALPLIQASNIKDIEIITNPSAKYDAEGTSGIINIILKKSKLEGVTTLINVNGGNAGNGSDYWNYGGDFITSINKGKFKFNIGGQYTNRNRFRSIEQIRITTLGEEESRIESEGLHRFFGTNYGGNAAMEYAPSESDLFSLGVDVKQRQWNAAANYFFDQYTNDSLISSYENRERTQRDFFVLSGSLGYQHLFKKNKDHYISLTSTYNLHDGTEDAQTEFFSLENVFQGGNRNTEIGPSNSVRVSLDYQYPLKNGMKLQIGTRGDFGFSSDDQDAYQYDVDALSYLRLDQYSTDVAYKQNVYAGYGIIGGKWKEKLGYQVGVRAEYTDRYIELTSNPDLNTIVQRLDWFPSAHFSYQLDDKNSFKASGSRRIERPRTWFLEPFLAWEDPYTVRQGNPNLLPEYIQSYEMGYIRELKKGSFSSELYFRNTSNITQRIQEVYDTNVIVKRPVNAGVSLALGLELAFNKKLAKWWTMDAGLNLFYFQIRGEIPGASLDQQSFTYRGRIANSFILPKDWKIQFTTNYESDVVTVQGVDKGVYSFDLAVKKDFFERKLSATLQFQNMFNTIKEVSWVNTSTLYSYRYATPMYPVINLAISMRLNNFSQKDKIRTEQGEEF